MLNKPTKLVATLSIAGLLLAACDREGPAERAGERLDEAGRDAAEAVQGIGEGPAERAGRKIDEAAAKAEERIDEAGAKMRQESDPPVQ